MPLSITGDLTATSSAILNVSSTTNIVVGMLIDNAKIPAGTVVTAVAAGVSITMSNPADDDGTGETIEFVSSFATAVATAVTVASAPLVLDAVLEAAVETTVRVTADLNSGQNEQLFTDSYVTVTVPAVELKTGREDILEGSANVSVTGSADLQTGRNEQLETSVSVSMTATAELTDQFPALATDVIVTVAGEGDLELYARPLFDATELYVDLVTRGLVTYRPGFAPAALRKVVFKRNDTPLVRVRFLRDGAISDIPDGTVVRVGAKAKADYGGAMVFVTGPMTRYRDEDSLPYFEDTLKLGVTSVQNLFGTGEAQKVDCVAEVEVSTPSLGAIASSQEFAVEMWNDIIRGLSVELEASAAASVTVDADLDPGTP